MNRNATLLPEDRLNKDNYEAWHFVIESFLETNEVLDYVKSDIVTNLTGQLQEAKNAQTPDSAAIRRLEKQIVEAKKKDAMARSIINTNISYEIVDKITNLKTAFAVMEKIKTLYSKKKNSDIQYLLKKMYSTKAKSIYECKEVITDLLEIFEKLENLKVKMDEIEKIRILYLSFPAAFRMTIFPREEETLNSFLKHAQHVINFQVYALNANDGISNESTSNEDFMDIDNINSIEKKINYFHQPKYCHICETNGHTTKECRYNNLSTRNKNKNKYKPNEKRNKSKKKNSNKWNQNKNKGKSVSNIQYVEQPEESKISLENLESMYQNDVNFIEKINEINLDQEETEKLNNIQNMNLKVNLSKPSEKKTNWVFDTGASEHITNNKDILEDYIEHQVTLKCANNSLCQFEGMGSYTANINGFPVKLDNVLYSKNINKNLLSGIKLAKNGLITNLKSRKGKTYLTFKFKNKNKKIINVGTFEADNNNIIQVPMNSLTTISNVEYENEIEEIDIDDQSKLLWHRRLGHFYHDNINKYLRIHNEKPVKCIDCKIAKLNRKTHKGEPPRATEILETIHSDVMGPISTISFNGKRYILTFIDEFSRKGWVFLVDDKKKIPEIIINFFTYIKNQFNHKIKNFHTDQGTEYNNKKILNYCEKHGINKTFSPPYSPQNNGLAERYNYTIISCARTLLRWAQIDLTFWDYAVNYANILYNIAPHKGIDNKIPNEIFFGEKVNLKYLKVFGCVAHFKDYSKNPVKVDSKGKKGVFLGFNNESHCYIIMDPKDYSIHLVNEVVFEEHIPSALKMNKNKTNKDKSLKELLNRDNYIPENYTINCEKIDEFRVIPTYLTSNKPSSNNNNNNNNNIEQGFNDRNNEVIEHNSNEETIKNNINIPPESSKSNNHNLDIDSSKISNKRKHSVDSDTELPTQSKQIINNDINPNKKIDNKSYSPGILPLKRNHKVKQDVQNKKQKYSIKKPAKRPSSPLEYEDVKRQKYSIDNIENADTIDIPKTYLQAIKSKYKNEWIKAMNDEIQNFYDNKVMTYVKHLPRGIKPTSIKWVYTIKKDGNGNFSKFKARLVARGFTQKKGIDYDLTYSPTLSIDSFKLIIALASKFHWNLMQLDIKAAYLNAPLDKRIFIPVPPGDKNFGKGFWLLNKSLYGLKQSGRQWNIHLTDFLKNNNFVQLRSEPCIFKKMEGNRVVCIIGVYVDDLLITGIKYHINDVIRKIKNNFRISKCSNANYILGINIEKQNFNYSISQTQIIKGILQKFNIKNIRKTKTPCTGDNKLEKENNNNKPFDKTTYKSAVGSLIYLSRCTRPDIAFAVGKVARKSENPTLADWKKVINIIKYLNYTKSYKITYKGKGEILAYTDSDFAGDLEDRKSTSGYIILMNKDPICWQSKKQTVVATSTAEAEYIATSDCTKKVLWIRNILYELFKINKPIKILTDNLASKITIENGELNNKLKHIEIKFYFNRENIINNKVNLEYIKSEKMLADPLTKNINGPQMSKYTDQIFDKQIFWSEGEC